MKTLLLLAVAAIAATARPTMIAPLSSDLNDYNLGTDGGERTLVFARSEAEFRNARIMVASRVGSGWSDPQPIGFSDERYADSDPWLTPNGRTLFFISNRPAEGRDPSRTDYDIWRSHLTAQGWSAPERLSDEVNSAGQELGPELHDGVLYFSSARRSGRGGLDIYTARRTATGFERAAPLDGALNTPASESDFTLSPDGERALFWRGGGGGTASIYLARRTPSGWSEPQPLSASVNHGPFNFTPSFAPDGRSLWYASTRPRTGQAAGLADLYQAPLPRG